MFFMMGITDRRKNLDYNQTEICSVWTIRTVSGIYDIHRIVTVFYSVFQMEQTLLCADQLLSHPV